MKAPRLLSWRLSEIGLLTVFPLSVALVPCKERTVNV